MVINKIEEIVVKSKYKFFSSSDFNQSSPPPPSSFLSNVMKGLILQRKLLPTHNQEYYYEDFLTAPFQTKLFDKRDEERRRDR